MYDAGRGWSGYESKIGLNIAEIQKVKRSAIRNKKNAQKGSGATKYRTYIELATAINKYFDGLIALDIDGNQYYKISPSITGLCNVIGISRMTLLNYKNKDEYAEVVFDAKRQIEQYHEERLISGQATSGVMFNLKNNFGWKDKSEVDTNITTNKKLEDILLELDSEDDE